MGWLVHPLVVTRIQRKEIDLTRRSIRGMNVWLLLLVFAVVGCADESVPVTMYRTPTCGCCLKWADHLEDNGFSVESVVVQDLASLKAQHSVPAELGACHTAIVGDYVVEGHVPAEDIHRLLTERPPVVGISAPGMPIGSPGMEGPNPERYEVLAFDRTGERTVFAQHGGS